MKTDGTVGDTEMRAIPDVEWEYGVEWESPLVDRGVHDGWYTSEAEARAALRGYRPLYRPRLVRRAVGPVEVVE